MNPDSLRVALLAQYTCGMQWNFGLWKCACETVSGFSVHVVRQRSYAGEGIQVAGISMVDWGRVFFGSTLNTFCIQAHRVRANHVWVAAQPEWSPIATGFRVEPNHAGCDHLSILFTHIIFAISYQKWPSLMFQHSRHEHKTSLNCVKCLKV